MEARTARLMSLIVLLIIPLLWIIVVTGLLFPVALYGFALSEFGFRDTLISVCIVWSVLSCLNSILPLLAFGMALFGVHLPMCKGKKDAVVATFMVLVGLCCALAFGMPLGLAPGVIYLLTYLLWKPGEEGVQPVQAPYPWPPPPYYRPPPPYHSPRPPWAYYPPMGHPHPRSPEVPVRKKRALKRKKA